MIQLRANPGPTGRLLTSLLQQRGLLAGEVRGVVNYGYGGPTELPCLNRKAGTFNKLQELDVLRSSGVPVVPFGTNPVEVIAPLLGRSLHHTKGKDIIVYQVRPDSLFRLGSRRHDFYTQLIPKIREFRVWAYRRNCIGIYEKVLTYPNKLGRRGRSREIWNRANGYAFLFRRATDIENRLRVLAIAAVGGVGLDFGAVDIIQSADGNFYVLEVNSAPGVEGERQCMKSLVNHIEKWVQGGFKKRNGEE